MSITRINEFQAKPGRGDSLREFLSSIMPLIESLDGCQSCQLLQSLDDSHRMVIIEVWDSVEARKASIQNVPLGNFEEMMKILAGPPKREYYST
jgi:quinol monooxygenase YgiN